MIIMEIDPCTAGKSASPRFLQGIYHFTDELDAEAGVRYSHETKTYTLCRSQLRCSNSY